MAGVAVVFHRLAARELREACRWYEERGAALGRSLAAEVDRAADRIAADPERWPIFRERYRWIRLRRFPYVLYDSVVDPRRLLDLALLSRLVPPTATHHDGRPMGIVWRGASI